METKMSKSTLEELQKVDELSEEKDVVELSEAEMKEEDIAEEAAEVVAEMTADEEEDDDSEDDDSEEDETEEEDDTEEEEDEMKESFEIDIDADINALVEGEELSESFKEKATLLYKTSIESKYNELRESLEEDFQDKLVESVQSIENDLVNKVDQFLDYVVEQWMDKNQLAVEHGVRTEVTESFIGALKSVFNEHYIDVPEGKEDLVESLESEKEAMTTKLDETISENVNLHAEVKVLKKLATISELSEGLTVSQVEKLEGLLESVDYDDSFAGKAGIIIESHFKKSINKNETETPAGLSQEEKEFKTKVDRYADYMASQTKK